MRLQRHLVHAGGQIQRRPALKIIEKRTERFCLLRFTSLIQSRGVLGVCHYNQQLLLQTNKKQESEISERATYRS